MALNLAKIAAPTGAETARLKPMRTSKPLVPKTFNMNATAGGHPQHSINDQFMLSDPYKPGTLQQTAQTGFNADVANAKNLAQMGTTPDAQIQADYAQRGQNEQNIYQSLAQQLAGVQTAQVAQGNAGSAALGAQNAGIGAAPGVLPTAGAQAVLGANTAATGNYGGSLQAAALSAGAQNQQHALDAGTIAQTANDQGIAKTLAGMLSGIPTASSRVDTMRQANQKVDAANLSTKLNIYQNDESAKAAALAAGRKDLYDQLSLKEKRDEAQWSNATKTKLGIAADQTRITTNADTNATRTATTATTQAGATARAKTAAAARVKAAKVSAAARVTAADKAAAAKKAASGTAAAGKTPTTYYVSYRVPDSTAVDPNTGKLKVTKGAIKQKPIPASVWQKYLASGPEGKRQLKILGFPNGTKIQSSTAK